MNRGYVLPKEVGAAADSTDPMVRSIARVVEEIQGQVLQDE